MSAGEVRAQSQADGQLTIAFDTSIASAYLDPAEVSGAATPFTFLYALHDALSKPLPGNNMAPCLAESWRESPDGLTYEFKLRVAAKLLHERVKSVRVVDPTRVRFVLHTPWPDFLAFYATPATGAAWIVPKKY